MTKIIIPFFLFFVECKLSIHIISDLSRREFLIIFKLCFTAFTVPRRRSKQLSTSRQNRLWPKSTLCPYHITFISSQTSSPYSVYLSPPLYTPPLGLRRILLALLSTKPDLGRTNTPFLHGHGVHDRGNVKAASDPGFFVCAVLTLVIIWVGAWLSKELSHLPGPREGGRGGRFVFFKKKTKKTVCLGCDGIDVEMYVCVYTISYIVLHKDKGEKKEKKTGKRQRERERERAGRRRGLWHTTRRASSRSAHLSLFPYFPIYSLLSFFFFSFPAFLFPSFCFLIY